MGQEGYDGKERTITKAKAVYKRKPHKFSPKDLLRVIVKINNDISIADARKTDNALKIRAIFTVAGSLYANVSDLFDQPPTVNDEEYERIKLIWRQGNDQIVTVISTYVAIQSGSPTLGAILDTVGRMINRGMEYLFTGSTGF